MEITLDSIIGIIAAFAVGTHDEVPDLLLEERLRDGGNAQLRGVGCEGVHRGDRPVRGIVLADELHHVRHAGECTGLRRVVY